MVWSASHWAQSKELVATKMEVTRARNVGLMFTWDLGMHLDYSVEVQHVTKSVCSASRGYETHFLTELSRSRGSRRRRGELPL